MEETKVNVKLTYNEILNVPDFQCPRRYGITMRDRDGLAFDRVL
jgi:hypothetical protein